MALVHVVVRDISSRQRKKSEKMLLEILAVFLVGFLLLYRYVTKNFDKWKKLGVPYKQGSFPSGSFPFFTKRRNFGDHIEKLCNEFKDERFFGAFMFGKPVLIVNDVELLKAIKVKDFNHFTDTQDEHISTNMRSGGELDALFNHHIGNAKGDEWKDTRSTFSPVFTSGKMKRMVKYIEDVSQKLLVEMEKKTDIDEEFELKDLTGKFSLDALASCAFGINFNSYGSEENSAFVKNAASIFKNDFKNGFGLMFKFIPGVVKIYEFFNISVQHPKEVKFFRDIVIQTLNSRRESGERRNDLVDMMLDCMKDQEQAEHDNEDETDQYQQDMKLSHKTKRQLTDKDIISNLMLFLIVGYDTTGMTLAYALYALSLNPDVQEKLQQEVDEAWECSGDKLPDYNTVQGLPYLEMVIMETLRMYTPANTTLRTCTEPYTLPGTSLTLQRNDSLMFSGSFLHKDPRHWTYPDTFYPEHWSPEEKSTRSPHAFQSFGQGPRACIGMRFAQLELKVALTILVKHLEFCPGSKTQTPLVLDPSEALGWVKGGLWAKVKRRAMHT